MYLIHVECRSDAVAQAPSFAGIERPRRRRRVLNPERIMRVVVWPSISVRGVYAVLRLLCGSVADDDTTRCDNMLSIRPEIQTYTPTLFTDTLLTRLCRPERKRMAGGLGCAENSARGVSFGLGFGQIHLGILLHARRVCFCDVENAFVFITNLYVCVRYICVLFSFFFASIESIENSRRNENRLRFPASATDDGEKCLRFASHALSWLWFLCVCSGKNDTRLALLGTQHR